jgi:hypothetical protein
LLSLRIVGLITIILKLLIEVNSPLSFSIRFLAVS